MRNRVALLLAPLGLASCASLETPRTPAEILSGYSYIPLDPLPVEIVSGAGCAAGQRPDLSTNLKKLNRLPDNNVRIAIRNLNASASAGFGPVKVGVEGSSYEVVLDYINVDVANIRFGYTPPSAGSPADGGSLTPVTVTSVRRLGAGESGFADGSEREVVIPVYVGVGLRLTANVTVRRGNINLASLGALTAAAQANRISGTLIVQTLGITGKQVTTTFPMPNELNATTIQNAILALGAIKAILYDENTQITPRVTGIYNPLPNVDQETINQIVSQLATTPIPWRVPCP